jgi:CTP synthase (UTP-ammonia lyase)
VTRIPIVGDYRADHETHPATTESIGHAAARLGVRADASWLPTDEIAGRGSDALARFAGVWLAPGSPYRSLQGALDAVTHARTTGMPLLGTCAGFQHVVIELARSLLGIADATHAEYDPSASQLVVDELACSLAGSVMDVDLVPGSVAQRAYGTARSTERYYCRFGLNAAFVEPLVTAGMVVSGRDAAGEPRIVELRSHPFFVATLFVPQSASTADAPHPLVEAFVSATHRRFGA